MDLKDKEHKKCTIHLYSAG